MAGYGSVSGHANGVSYRANTDLNGYSAGVYGTWYQDAVNRTGAYLDSWLMYNWLKNKVNGQGLPTENYRSRGFIASVETGYSILLHQGESRSLYLTPQAQLTWMGVKSHTHYEANGTRIEDDGQGNLQSRLGARLYLRDRAPEEKAMKPYIEANWLHNTHNFGVKMNDTVLTQEGARNIGELKLGVQGQVSRELNIWGGVAWQKGDQHYDDISAMLGLKYAF
jgi:autotransporter family porin